MPVITVSRELGSQGTYVAERVAEELGYHFVDKTTIQSILEQYGLVEFEDEYRSPPSFWDRFSDRVERRDVMMDMLRRATLALARHGNVLMLGRGCYGMLQGFSDVLNVRIQAPLATRIKRVMQVQGIARWDEAETFIKEADDLRTWFVKSCYGVQLDDTRLFNVVVDTGKVPPDTAAAWLVEAVRVLENRAARDEEPATSSIEAESVLEQVVSQVIGCSAVHR